MRQVFEENPSLAIRLPIIHWYNEAKLRSEFYTQNFAEALEASGLFFLGNSKSTQLIVYANTDNTPHISERYIFNYKNNSITNEWKLIPSDVDYRNSSEMSGNLMKIFGNLKQISNSLKQISDNPKEILDSLEQVSAGNTVIEERLENLKQVSNNLKQILDKPKGMLDNLERISDNSEQILYSLKKISGDLKKRLDSLEEIKENLKQISYNPNPKQRKQISDNLKEISDNLKQILDNLKWKLYNLMEISNNIKQILDNPKEISYKLMEISDNLNKMLKNPKKISDDPKEVKISINIKKILDNLNKILNQEAKWKLYNLNEILDNLEGISKDIVEWTSEKILDDLMKISDNLKQESCNPNKKLDNLDEMLDNLDEILGYLYNILNDENKCVIYILKNEGEQAIERLNKTLKSLESHHEPKSFSVEHLIDYIKNYIPEKYCTTDRNKAAQTEGIVFFMEKQDFNIIEVYSDKKEGFLKIRSIDKFYYNRNSHSLVCRSFPVPGNKKKEKKEKNEYKGVDAINMLKKFLMKVESKIINVEKFSIEKGIEIEKSMRKKQEALMKEEQKRLKKALKDLNLNENQIAFFNALVEKNKELLLGENPKKAEDAKKKIFEALELNDKQQKILDSFDSSNKRKTTAVVRSSSPSEISSSPDVKKSMFPLFGNNNNNPNLSNSGEFSDVKNSLSNQNNNNSSNTVKPK
jgi:ABC-type transporter Mla subunit MlaD